MSETYNPNKSSPTYTPLLRVSTSQNGTYVEVPAPSSYKFAEEDISANNAGRTADYKMNKLRKATIVKIELQWNYPTIATASQILTQFNPEYIWVKYLNARTGMIETSEFYVGNRNSPLFNGETQRWTSVAFNIIERQGTVY